MIAGARDLWALCDLLANVLFVLTRTFCWCEKGIPTERESETESVITMLPGWFYTLQKGRRVDIWGGVAGEAGEAVLCQDTVSLMSFRLCLCVCRWAPIQIHTDPGKYTLCPPFPHAPGWWCYLNSGSDKGPTISRGISKCSQNNSPKGYSLMAGIQHGIRSTTFIGSKKCNLNWNVQISLRSFEVQELMCFIELQTTLSLLNSNWLIYI